VEYKLRGSFLGWFVGLAVPIRKKFILLWLLWSARYKIFFSSPYTISLYVSLSPGKLGRHQAVGEGHLSFTMCLRNPDMSIILALKRINDEQGKEKV
jgi:hypothetical protein